MRAFVIANLKDLISGRISAIDQPHSSSEFTSVFAKDGNNGNLRRGPLNTKIAIENNKSFNSNTLFLHISEFFGKFHFQILNWKAFGHEVKEL